MEILPPIIMECPECGEQYLVSQYDNQPSEKAVRFSDGFFIDEINWRTPSVIGCVTCELGFFTQNGKVIARPGWDEFNQKWPQLKKATPPHAGALALELRVRKNIPLQHEINLRKEFWYSGNHTEKGKFMLAQNEKFNHFWIQSLDALEKLLNVNIEGELLLKAEINRHLARFEMATTLLEKSYQNLAVQIHQRALASDSTIFEIQ
ncbi:MAG TPA: hypothetical protein VJY41_11785 [Prolixibacteraceae bacterium]|nr:hypothetical protein [Prolixibacteraceae bacterium]